LSAAARFQELSLGQQGLLEVPQLALRLGLVPLQFRPMVRLALLQLLPQHSHRPSQLALLREGVHF
jgi:hypothetical protein